MMADTSETEQLQQFAAEDRAEAERHRARARWFRAKRSGFQNPPALYDRRIKAEEAEAAKADAAAKEVENYLKSL